VQVVEGGRVVGRKVTAGLHITDTVEITAGLSPGERVVAKAGTFLRTGDLVSPVEPKIGAAKMN
jgi:HlyD family secretion protein